MFKQHARFVDRSVRLMDLVLLTVALPIAHQLYSHAPAARAEAPPIERLWVSVIAVLILWIAVSASFRVYAAYRTRSLVAEVGPLARALAALALGVSAGLYLVNSPLPRLFVGFYFASAFALLATSRIVLRTAARAVRRQGHNTRSYAIVGAGPEAEEVARTFADNPQWGFQLAGFIVPDDRAVPSPGGRLLGTLDGLEAILDQHVIDHVVFAVPREGLPALEKAVKLCEEAGVAVAVSLEPLRLGAGKMSLFELSDLSMLVFTRTPSDVGALAAKRIFDIVVSGTALLVLAPLFLVIAIAIRLGSPGPVFFRQTRVGLNGRSFRMVKFRSMYADAEARLQALQAFNEMNGPVFKMKNDPRITPIGRFIRRTSIDELPQFWNVLRGQMSIVGPRPPLPAEVQKYERWQRRRLSVRPGITCTWQVSGRNGISFERWMELDLEYIDNWSLRQDLRIFLKTIPAVLTARGAS